MQVPLLPELLEKRELSIINPENYLTDIAWADGSYLSSLQLIILTDSIYKKLFITNSIIDLLLFIFLNNAFLIVILFVND